MHRIAAAMLIAATALAFNGSMLREALAGEPAINPPAPRGEFVQQVPVRNAKVLSLLVILETLRQAPISLDPQKV
jgi:hypothetical protein